MFAIWLNENMFEIPRSNRLRRYLQCCFSMGNSFQFQFSISMRNEFAFSFSLVIVRVRNFFQLQLQVSIIQCFVFSFSYSLSTSIKFALGSYNVKMIYFCCAYSHTQYKVVKDVICQLQVHDSLLIYGKIFYSKALIVLALIQFQ